MLRRELTVALLALAGCPGPPRESAGPTSDGSTPRAGTAQLVSRPIRSGAPIRLHVDPETGRDDNDGSDTAPLATLQEALNRLPNFITHPTVIELADGEYEAEPWQINSSIHFINFLKEDGFDNPFLIVGNPESPGNVRLSNTGWINLSFRGSVPYRTVIRGVQFDGTVQNYAGAMKLERCRFTGLNTDDPSYGLDGYDALSIVEECWFGGEVGTAVYANQGHRVYLTECVGDVPTLYETAVFGEIEYSEDNDIDGQRPE